MSNFAFMKADWPYLHESASKAESLANPDVRTACFYARRGLELLVHWLYKFEGKLQLPYQDNLSALIDDRRPTIDLWHNAAQPILGLHRICPAN